MTSIINDGSIEGLSLFLNYRRNRARGRIDPLRTAILVNLLLKKDIHHLKSPNLFRYQNQRYLNY